MLLKKILKLLFFFSHCSLFSMAVSPRKLALHLCVLYLTFDVCQVKCNAPHPKFPPYIVGCNLAAPLTPCSVRWLLTMSDGSFSWRRLKKSTETKLPKVSITLCCAISLTHSCIQKLESPPEIIPATTLAQNFMEPKPNEVRWSVNVLRPLWPPYGFSNWMKFHRAPFQPKKITLWPPWKKF